MDHFNPLGKVCMCRMRVFAKKTGPVRAGVRACMCVCGSNWLSMSVVLIGIKLITLLITKPNNCVNNNAVPNCGVIISLLPFFFVSQTPSPRHYPTPCDWYETRKFLIPLMLVKYPYLILPFILLLSLVGSQISFHH